MNSLKGVNKQIVEINYTRDDYVEKAILIINPDKRHLGQKLIKQKANAYINSLDLPTSQKKQSPWINLFRFSFHALIGAGFMALILYFI